MTGSVWWPELHSHTAPIRKQAQLCSPHRPPPSVGYHPRAAQPAWEGREE